jgi:hypothetical protein
MFEGEAYSRASCVGITDLALDKVTSIGKPLRVVREHEQFGAHIYATEREALAVACTRGLGVGVWGGWWVVGGLGFGV